MIHYNLMPNREHNALRREYRLRLAIALLLFISCALVLGIVSLLPSYIYTYGQEKEALLRQETLEKSRRESGAEQIEKDLIMSQRIAEKMNADANPIAYADIIQKVLAHRRSDVTLISFSFTPGVGTSTLASISMEGKSTTREALLAFKKALEEDASFANVDVPLSDIAKNRDFSFSLRLTAQKQ